jgi:intein/homing endonuclease
MAELDNIASQLLKSANEADKNYAKTRDQSEKDKATRLRVIVQNLKNIVLGASDLNGLSDVTISAPANAQVLAYNSTTTQWENQTPGGGGGGGDMLKCFHPDTELLTLNGWKKITEISFDDEVATLNQETKQLEYQVPNHIFKYEYDGELIGRETKQLSYLVTPNHRMYVRKWYGGQRGLVWSENFYWERADEVSEKIRSFPITAKWTGVKTETNPFGIDDDLFLEFLGWFLSEGCVVDTKIYVTQTKSKTIAECTRVMVDMARSLGRTLGHNQNAHFNFRHSELAKFLSQFGKHAHNKFIPAFVKNLPAEKLILFYNAYYKGDGHLNGNNITTVSKRMADDLQEVILKLGGYATITKCPPAITSYGVRDFYRLIVTLTIYKELQLRKTTIKLNTKDLYIA